jgi:hypothetical protein
MRKRRTCQTLVIVVSTADHFSYRARATVGEANKVLAKHSGSLIEENWNCFPRESFPDKCRRTTSSVTGRNSRASHFAHFTFGFAADHRVATHFCRQADIRSGRSSGSQTEPGTHRSARQTALGINRILSRLWRRGVYFRRISGFVPRQSHYESAVFPQPARPGADPVLSVPLLIPRDGQIGLTWGITA